MTVLTGSYDLWLVALSVVIAILAAGAALDVVARVAATRGQARAAWLVGGAVAMGLGIWSMHYTGMLAFRLPVPVLYHVPTVTLSLLAAVAASLMALHVASREHLSRARTAVGSVVMGSGIAAMHYTGMAAMRLPATARWHPVLVTLSVLIAIGVSAVALWLAFHYGHGARGAWTWPKLGSAVLMGLAIPGMHYTGMAAATFVMPNPPPPIPSPSVRPRTEPLGAERYRVQFTADRETHAQLEELRALLRHQRQAKVRRYTRELGSEGRCISRIGEARRGADDLKPVGCNVKPVA